MIRVLLSWLDKFTWPVLSYHWTAIVMIGMYSYRSVPQQRNNTVAKIYIRSNHPHHLLPPRQLTSFHLQICEDHAFPTKGGGGAPEQKGSLVVTNNVPDTSQCFLATERKRSGRGNYRRPLTLGRSGAAGLVGLPLSTRSSSDKPSSFRTCNWNNTKLNLKIV